MNSKTIAIDLTPVLPSGSNGGAKGFAIELVRSLILVAPTTQFLLLTNSVTHVELKSLEGSNCRRVLIVDKKDKSFRSFFIKVSLYVYPFVPHVIKRWTNKIVMSFFTILKRARTKSFLSDLKVDLLFCPFTAPTYFSKAIPTVCTVHDLQHKKFPQFFRPEEHNYRNFVFEQVCSKATAIAADSDYTRDSISHHSKYRLTNLRTIYIRLPKPEITIDSCELISRYSLTNQRYLIYPANFWQHKNHEMLFTAFGTAVTNAGLLADIKLVCTGDVGKRLDWLKQVVLKMGLQDKVIFPGYIRKLELDCLITHAGGMIFPSLYEGFGIPIIEAMSVGVPIACSNVTSLPEVASDAAIFFDPRIPEQIANAMVELFTNKELRDQLINTGKKRSEEFLDPIHMAREYLELFSDAMNMQHAKVA